MVSQTNPTLTSPTNSGLFLGVDGGGTKTHAVLIDDSQRILGEGLAGASNPLRVGLDKAAQAIKNAVEQACQQASVSPADITSARVGIAGGRQIEQRKRLREALSPLRISDLRVLTDANIALFGATGGAPGLIVIAGTGSICCGINERGKQACAGGWGPVAGDEGSGVWIARRALQQVAQATDGRGGETELTQAAYQYFGTNTPDDLLAAIYAPEMTNEKIAGFGRSVVVTAHAGDVTAQEILAAAGRELGIMASSVIRRLGMQREKFQVAYVGSIFSAGEIMMNPLRAEITRVAPAAFLAQPKYPPALAAALLALKERPQLALAG